VTVAPNTIHSFIELIKNRLEIKRNDNNLSEQDQEELISVIINEAKMKWKEASRMIQDTLLVTKF
jgi:hypothetical protein